MDRDSGQWLLHKTGLRSSGHQRQDKYEPHSVHRVQIIFLQEMEIEETAQALHQFQTFKSDSNSLLLPESHRTDISLQHSWFQLEFLVITSTLLQHTSLSYNLLDKKPGWTSTHNLLHNSAGDLLVSNAVNCSSASRPANKLALSFLLSRHEFSVSPTGESIALSSCTTQASVCFLRYNTQQLNARASDCEARDRIFPNQKRTSSSKSTKQASCGIHTWHNTYESLRQGSREISSIRSFVLAFAWD
ncbi:hypothetical protein Mapa_011514 [Marchantia paleacea]|nr:hypothetical protein Mapa_011514 [Marchantia paleacea]